MAKKAKPAKSKKTPATQKTSASKKPSSSASTPSRTSKSARTTNSSRRSAEASEREEANWAEELDWARWMKAWVSEAKVATAGDLRAKSSLQVRWIASSAAQVKAQLKDIAREMAAPAPWGKLLQQQLQAWLKDHSQGDSLQISAPTGPWVFLRLTPPASAADLTRDPLNKSDFLRARDLAGVVWAAAKTSKVAKLAVDFQDLPRESARGFLLGLEMASYTYMQQSGQKPIGPRPSLALKGQALRSGSDEKKSSDNLNIARDASRLGVAVNLARHLTNMPGGTLTPAVYANLAQDLILAAASTSRRHEVSVEVWEGERLRHEQMGLLLAVGGSAEVKPRFVHIRYRPDQRGAETRPIALVGKGITFDTGGLDIKPSQGMRWMKKDMGGSAAALAVAWWAIRTELPLALDVYLPLAENAVGAGSFRPGDVIRSRSGRTVEIHNTDAEGRLVLADAMDVAIKATEKPAALIDLATLTGAIKVALGAEVAGLFANSDELAREIYDASLKRGDYVWRMPLFQNYKTALKSNVADLINCTDGFGGAITAALFLESFVAGTDIPWAHIDLYAWRDSASGPWQEPGGSGQGVSLLADVLSRFVGGKWADGD